MPLDVPGDERTERSDLETLPSRIFERRSSQPAAVPLSLERLVDLGVREHDPVLALAVRREADHLFAEPELVARLFGDVDDVEVLSAPSALEPVRLVRAVAERLVARAAAAAERGALALVEKVSVGVDDADSALDE